MLSTSWSNVNGNEASVVVSPYTYTTRCIERTLIFTVMTFCDLSTYRVRIEFGWPVDVGVGKGRGGRKGKVEYLLHTYLIKTNEIFHRH